jgi:tRNA (guanine37-N1)-methyltransferase
VAFAGDAPGSGVVVEPRSEAVRVLLVFADPPLARPLAARLERERLREMFFGDVLHRHNVEVDILCHGVTSDRLRARLAERGGYHVVHWSGHRLPPGLTAAGGAPKATPSAMRVSIVTLFPELFQPFLTLGMVGRAVAGGAIRVRLKSPRDFGLGRHKSVDDTPYGGGSGMVMRVDCIVECLEALDAEPFDGDAPAEGRAHRVLLCPQGAPFGQRAAAALVARERVALVCGRYEGFDDRVRGFVDEEVSLGDFVLSGGEVAAMAVVDACSRLLPGVLGNAASAEHESHSEALGGLLEYPQFTRPVEFRGARVPEVLQNGNHAAIDAWRRAEAEQRTRERRPDLWAAHQTAHAPERPT